MESMDDLEQATLAMALEDSVDPLQGSIEVARRGLSATAEDQACRVHLFRNLINLLGQRYSITKAIADIDELIQVIRQAIDATPKDHTDYVGFLNALVTRLNNRYQRVGDLEDISEPIQVISKILAQMTEDDPEFPKRLNALALWLHYKHTRNGSMADLDEAIRTIRWAIRLIPEGHPDYIDWLHNLGACLSNRFRRGGASKDLDEAIQVALQAIKLIPEDHLALIIPLSDLGVYLYDRYMENGAVADLDEAILVTKQGIDLKPDDHPSRPKLLHNLGCWLTQKYLVNGAGALKDLEDAIQSTRQAIQIMPTDPPDYAEALSTLGSELSHRYSRTGAIANLEEAIKVTQQAINFTPENDISLAERLNDLGVLLSNRNAKTGALWDLEEAIQVIQQAIDLTPEEHPDLPERLNSLAKRICFRFSRTRSITDLQEAIQITRRAIGLMPADHPDLAGALQSLGVCLTQGYLETGALDDLEEAIQNLQQAVNLSPEMHPNLSERLSDLGYALGQRYMKNEDPADQYESLLVLQKAADLTPEGHPGLGKRLYNLGVWLCHTYKRTEALSDLEKATLSCRSVLNEPSSPTMFRIMAGIQVLHLYAIQSDWEQAHETAKLSVSLIPKLLTRSLENSDRQSLLSEVVGMSSNAAAAALNAKQSPLVAVNLLEQGRNVLATAINDTRADILELEKAQPYLADMFKRLRDELDLSQPSVNSYLEQSLLNASWRPQASKRYDMANEFDRVITRIRQCPEFEDFLLPPSTEQIYSAATQGPIVFVNVSRYRCDAILVEQHQIRALPLPKLRKEDVEERAQGHDLGRAEILEWLWDVVAFPILEALNFAQPPANENWSRLWWIPTGALSKFPLHAAGRHDERLSEAVLDRVTSSYSPSIKAILQGRSHSNQLRTSLETNQAALLVSMEHTLNHSRLPFAKKEVAMLYDIYRHMGLNPIEPGRRNKDIKPYLTCCKVFHFAGHGYSHPNDPLKSELLLEDRDSNPLTVANLLEINLRQNPPFLAYLSACSTSRIRNERLFDESIHLINACQLAGFRHVIGTLWEVNDEICVDVARLVYEGIRDGGMTDESVCRGLHNASRSLRDHWLNASSTMRDKRLVMPAEPFSVEEETSSNNGRHQDESVFARARDVLIDERPRAYWVPYVHFGV